MVFWALICAMLGVAILILLVPLTRTAKPRDETYFRHYRHRLSELDHAIASDPADDTLKEERTTAARHLLRLQEGRSGAAHDGRRPAYRTAASLVALFGVPLLALGVYISLGEPERPDVPLAAQQAQAGENANMQTMVARVEAHLKSNPDDVQGWTILARVYGTSGDYDKRRQAVRELVRLQGRTSANLADLAEAEIQIDGNLVPASARALLDEALESDPTNRKAAYYRTVAMEQSGEFEKALSSWKKLRTTSPDDAQWQTLVSQRIARLEDFSNQAAGQIAEQASMIEGMVAGLRARLIEDPTDLDGWTRLMRSYEVLNRPADAVVALDAALARGDLEPEVRRKLTALRTDMEGSTQ